MNDISHEKLLEALFDGVYYVDLAKRITYWNKAAERITGFGREEVVGFSCADNILRHVDGEGRELCANGCPLAASLRDGQVREAEVYLHHKQGHRVPVTVRIVPVKDDKGRVIGGVEVFADSSSRLELLKEMEQLKRQAYVDQLTQVGNRRYCEMVLDTRVHEFQKFESRFGLIFLDIDHFKKINDTLGHQVGDQVLVMVARTIANTLRRMDMVARWGGEEFVVLLANVTPEMLPRMAERIRTFIECSFLMVNSAPLAVTASLGATMSRPGDSAESVIERADGLMYESKEKGRNRISIG